MASEAKKNERRVEEGCEVSGIYLVSDKSRNVTSPSTSEATAENQITDEVSESDANEIMEEPTDELSVLLSEKVDGVVNPDEPLFIPKNPLPDPQLVALAKSMESCYDETNEAWTDNTAAKSHFDLSKSITVSSLLPPPTKTYPWIKVVSFVAAAAVIGLAGAVGGWYAALKSTRVINDAKSASAVFPSADKAAPPATHAVTKDVDITPPALVTPAAEPTANTASTEPVAVSKSIEQDNKINKTTSARLKEKPAKTDSADRISRRPAPERTSSAVAQPQIAKNAVAAAASSTERTEDIAAVAETDQTEDAVVESRDVENPAPLQDPEAVQSAAIPEANAADGPVVAPSLPEVLTRDQVLDGFKSIYQQINQCAAGRHGVAKIKATVAGSGRVVFALVDGAFKGSPEGSCMARAVRKATFPQFAKSKLTVEFPYVL